MKLLKSGIIGISDSPIWKVIEASTVTSAKSCTGRDRVDPLAVVSIVNVSLQLGIDWLHGPFIYVCVILGVLSSSSPVAAIYEPLSLRSRCSPDRKKQLQMDRIQSLGIRQQRQRRTCVCDCNGTSDRYRLHR